jgi:glutamate racemase
VGAAVAPRVRHGQVRRQRVPPCVQVERAAVRPRNPVQHLRGDSGRGGEHRDIARERFQHRQPEALALRGHEDGVGGVHPERHLLRVDVAKREQPNFARNRQRPVVTLLGATWIGGEQEVWPFSVEAKCGTCLGPGNRPEAPQVDSAREHRDLTVHRPARNLASERLRDGRREVDEAQRRQRDRARAWVGQIGAVHRHGPRPAGRSEGGPRSQPEVGMNHVEAIVAVAAAQLGCRLDVGRWAARMECKQLKLQLRDPLQRPNLIAHKAAQRRVPGGWVHVRDDQSAHQPAERSRPTGRRRPMECGFAVSRRPEPDPPHPLTPSVQMSVSPDQPVAVFDSGVGGLTVLHELLVSLPTEDYLYLGDTARFPYGDRTQEELQVFAIEIADHLLDAGAKLLVVACNAASSAAFDVLERHLNSEGRDVDLIGVVAPATQLAVAGSRTGRIGLLATPATVGSCAYEQAVRLLDPHVHLESVACPDLAPIIQGGFPFDAHVVEIVRQYCAPLRAAEVDTVILGCTHYPLVAPMLQRSLGRGVTLVSSGTGVARSVERALASRGLLNPQPGEGSYRFRCTGDVESFRALGTRFLQMPLDEVVQVELEARVTA